MTFSQYAAFCFCFCFCFFFFVARSVGLAGKAHAFEPLRAWFAALYEVLLGQSQGPRFGGFVHLYGVEQTRALIAKALKGELAGQG